MKWIDAPVTCGCIRASFSRTRAAIALYRQNLRRSIGPLHFEPFSRRG
jgi:hypothetical protein